MVSLSHLEAESLGPDAYYASAASSIIHDLNEIWKRVLGIHSCFTNKYSLLHFHVTLNKDSYLFRKLTGIFFNKTEAQMNDISFHMVLYWWIKINVCKCSSQLRLLHRELLRKIDMHSSHADIVLNWPFKESNIVNRTDNNRIHYSSQAGFRTLFISCAVVKLWSKDSTKAGHRPSTPQ